MATIADNIRGGRPDASHNNRARRAAKAADAHQPITALPEGYDTTPVNAAGCFQVDNANASRSPAP